MAKMFDVFRELREKYPQDADFDRAKARWLKEHPIPRARYTRSSTISIMS